jgi:peptide/nickel transport system substrate-binding protein
MPHPTSAGTPALRRVLGTILAVALLGSACGPDTPSPSGSQSPIPDASSADGSNSAAPPSAVPAIDLTTSSYAPADGPDGGTLVIGDYQPANQFNPYYRGQGPYAGQQTESNLASAAWATLVVVTSDYRYMPDLATSVPTIDNGGVQAPGEGDDAMTVTWTLRDGLKWSDGEPLTCDDFKYAWEWVLDTSNYGVVTTGFAEIKSIDCPSPTTMVWHFRTIYEAYITLMTAPLPRHYLAGIPMSDQVNGQGFLASEIAKLPVSGAFKYDSVTPEQQVQLSRNPNYTSFSTGKPAHLEKIVFKWYADAATMIAAFKAGAVDIATDLTETDLPAVSAFGAQVSSIPSLEYEVLRPNWSAGPFDPGKKVGGCSRNAAVADRGSGCPMADEAMRKAVSVAIDKNAINSGLLGGTVTVANTNVSLGAWFFSDQPPATFDPAQAGQLLDDAGWVVGADGIREKDGLRAKIELCTTTKPVRIETAGLISTWLRAVGIETVANAVDEGLMFADYDTATADTPCALSTSNFDLAEQSLTASPDPLGQYFTYHSSQFEPYGVNDAQVIDAGIDQSLDTVRDSADFRVVKDAMAEFQKIYVERTVEIPLYYRKRVDLFGPRVGNLISNPTPAGPTWNAVDWYVVK